MPSAKSTPPSWFKSFGNAIVRYFARGVLIFAPILITVSILHWMFVSLDGLLQPYVQTPGLGFVIVLVALLVIGWVGSLFVVGRLINLVDSWLERLPGISFIYTSVRDLFKAFVGNKRRFQHTVRARLYTSDDVWVIGFSRTKICRVGNWARITSPCMSPKPTMSRASSTSCIAIGSAR
jgi:uncharacterized membrane protein